METFLGTHSDVTRHQLPNGLQIVAEIGPIEIWNQNPMDFYTFSSIIYKGITIDKPMEILKFSISILVGPISATIWSLLGKWLSTNIGISPQKRFRAPKSLYTAGK